MKVIYLLILFLISSFSAAAPPLSLGLVAQNMTEPMDIVSGFVNVGCLIVGIACLFASIVKYFEHRRSPLAVPISTVIWLVIIAFLLLLLPFTYMITGHGVPLAILWGG